MQTEDESLTPKRGWRIALVALPAFLLLSSVGAMWIWWNGAKDPAPDPRLALPAAEVAAEELDDHLHKLDEMIGPRDWERPEGRRAMRRAIAFIEGTLSPQNYGFAVEKGHYITVGGELWSTLWVDLPGSEEKREVVIVAAPYDDLAAAPAVVLGALNDLRDENARKTVRAVFYPSRLFARGEGKEPTVVLRDGETLVKLLVPTIPESEGRITGAELEPITRDLVEKVRELAR